MWSSTFLDEEGRPSFNLLQNYDSSKAHLIYYVFDALIVAGRDVMRETLDARRELLEKKILPKLSEPIRYSKELRSDLPTLIEAVKAQGMEGLVAKRRNSRYEAGQRSGDSRYKQCGKHTNLGVGGNGNVAYPVS